MHSLAHIVCSVLLLGAPPFEPAAPRFDEGVQLEARCCDRCRTIEARFERSQETIVRLAEEIDLLRRKLAELERRAKKPAEPPRKPSNLAPGVEWEWDTYYELGADKQYYYRDKEPRKPRTRMYPVLLP